jgi:hypothetical protein
LLNLAFIPPSVPDVHSPLRNEVRYSPGTRSSMLSFGSFGKQRRSPTEARRRLPNSFSFPIVDSPFPAGDPDSEATIGKLKEFGRRRRASVGDLLSGIQLQGPQAPQGPRFRRLRKAVSRCGRASPFAVGTLLSEATEAQPSVASESRVPTAKGLARPHLLTAFRNLRNRGLLQFGFPASI